MVSPLSHFTTKAWSVEAKKATLQLAGWSSQVTGSYFRTVVDDGGGGIAVTPSRPDEDGAERLKENYRYPITLNNFLDAGPRIPWLCERLCFAMTSNNPCTKGEPPAVLRTSSSR